MAAVMGPPRGRLYLGSTRSGGSGCSPSHEGDYPGFGSHGIRSVAQIIFLLVGLFVVGIASHNEAIYARVIHSAEIGGPGTIALFAVRNPSVEVKYASDDSRVIASYFSRIADESRLVFVAGRYDRRNCNGIIGLPNVESLRADDAIWRQIGKVQLIYRTRKGEANRAS